MQLDGANLNTSSIERMTPSIGKIIERKLPILAMAGK
jgi:hypothetical protein